jgi:hypothetical protein
MPKLPAVIESLDKVEEAFRGAYVEKEGGGGFVLDADVEAHPTVAGLKTAKERATAERKRLEAALKPFEGVDRARYDQLVKEAEEREAAGGGEKDPEKLRKKIEADIRKELEPVITERDTLKGQLEKHQLFDVADAAALKGGVLPERLEDARAVYGRFVRLHAGKVEVLDKEGDPTGESVEKFFAEQFKAMKPWFYAGSGASGGGAQQSASGGGAGVVTLTREQANDKATYDEALKKVGGDHSKIKVAPAAA